MGSSPHLWHRIRPGVPGKVAAVDSTDGIVWLTRAFLVVALLLVLALALLPLLVIVKPVVTEALRARAAGDWWLPFLPREDGGYGPLAANRWWALFRAQNRGQTGDLAWRWGMWVAMSVGLMIISGYLAIAGAKLIRLGWT